jgi:hypothetical protein
VTEINETEAMGVLRDASGDDGGVRIGDHVLRPESCPAGL